MDSIQSGQSILYLWNGEMTSDIEKNVTEIKAKGASVNVENAGRLDIGEFITIITRFIGFIFIIILLIYSKLFSVKI
jgi:hypothetical protein